MIEVSDVLLTFAELALGFTGFTGMVVTFGRQGNQVTVFFVETLLVISLGALFFSLIPIGLLSFGMVAGDVWRYSSGLLALVLGFGTRQSLRQAKEAGLHREREIVGLFISVMNFVVFVFLVLNAVGVFEGFEWGVYFCSLIWMLVLSGVQFSQLVLRWKSDG